MLTSRIDTERLAAVLAIAGREESENAEKFWRSLPESEKAVARKQAVAAANFFELDGFEHEFRRAVSS